MQYLRFGSSLLASACASDGTNKIVGLFSSRFLLIIFRITSHTIPPIFGLLLAGFGASLSGDEPSTVATGQAVPFRPEDSLLVIQREIDGVPKFSAVGMVYATDDRRAYITTRLAMKKEWLENKAGRYIAIVGAAGSERRFELEQLVEYKKTRYFVFAAPKNELPAPVPMLPLPEVVEGQELTFFGIYVNNDYETKFERKQHVHKVEKFVTDGLGRVSGFETSGRGTRGMALMLDADRRILAMRAIGSSGDAMHSTTQFLKSRTATQLDDLRIRVSQSSDEAVLDFAMQTFDPFDSGLVPRLLVSHPSTANRNTPDYDRRLGRFVVFDGEWQKPTDGTEIELKRAESVDPEFELAAAPNEWCRASRWIGTYRFRIAEKDRTVLYQCVLIDKTGRIHSYLEGDSHVKVGFQEDRRILFEHPVNEQDHGKLIERSP